MTNYTVRYTNSEKGIIPISPGQEYNELPTTLFGRTRLRYGSKMNENLLHLLENFACPSLVDNAGDRWPDPAYLIDTLIVPLVENPVDGQFWYDNREEKMRYYSAASGKWVTVRDAENVVAICGIIADGEQLPLPVGRNGRVFSYSECSWIVSPFNYPTGVTEMVCKTDSQAIVTHQYKPTGSDTFVSGTVNYMIVAIADNENLGTQRPDPTPLPDVPCFVYIFGNDTQYFSGETVTWDVKSRKNSTVTFFIDGVQVGVANINENESGSVTFDMPTVIYDGVTDSEDILVTAQSDVSGCGSFASSINVKAFIPCEITAPSTATEAVPFNITVASGSYPGEYVLSSDIVGTTFTPPSVILSENSSQVVEVNFTTVFAETLATVTATGPDCTDTALITVSNSNPASCTVSVSASTIPPLGSVTITGTTGEAIGSYDLIVDGSTVDTYTEDEPFSYVYTDTLCNIGSDRIVVVELQGPSCNNDTQFTVTAATPCSLTVDGGATLVNEGSNLTLNINGGSCGGTFTFSSSAGGTLPASIIVAPGGTDSVTYTAPTVASDTVDNIEMSGTNGCASFVEILVVNTG